jgi:hypothetical protein
MYELEKTDRVPLTMGAFLFQRGAFMTLTILASIASAPETLPLE